MTRATDVVAPDTISAFSIPLDRLAVSRWCTPMANKTTRADVEEGMR
jgi:hypothetical protein